MIIALLVLRSFLEKRIENEKNIPTKNTETVVKSYSGYVVDNKKDLSKCKPSFLGEYDLESYLIKDVSSARFEIKYQKGILRYCNGSFYSCHKIDGDKGYVFNTYYKSVLVDSYHIIKIPNKEKIFHVLKKGANIDEIEKIDKTASDVKEKYSFYSTHRFDDGTILQISYMYKHNDYYVKDWIYQADRIRLFENLLKKDYKLIQ